MTGQVPVHSVRVSSPIWNEAKNNAAAEGLTISDLVARLLDQYNSSEARKRKTASNGDG